MIIIIIIILLLLLLLLLLLFIDHPKTLMFVINQHHNMTHPKLISIPRYHYLFKYITLSQLSYNRGLPLTWDHTEKLIFDTIQHNLNNVKRSRLLFSATSKWGKRGQIIKCISEKFSINDFEGIISYCLYQFYNHYYSRPY